MWLQECMSGTLQVHQSKLALHCTVHLQWQLLSSNRQSVVLNWYPPPPQKKKKKKLGRVTLNEDTSEQVTRRYVRLSICEHGANVTLSYLFCVV